MGESDEVLITRFRQGDRNVYAELVKRYQQPIYYFLLRLTRREEDARDLSQRTFIRAMQALDRFEGRSSFKTWLFQIASNLSRNHHRDTTRVQTVEVEDDTLVSEPFALDHMMGEEMRGQLREAVESLPPRQKAVLLLRVYQDMPFQDIADREGITVGNARVNFHLAVKTLKATLDGMESIPDADHELS